MSELIILKDECCIGESCPGIPGYTIRASKNKSDYSLFVPHIVDIVDSSTIFNCEIKSRTGPTPSSDNDKTDPCLRCNCSSTGSWKQRFRKGMILSVYIKNFRSIVELELHPRPGLNILAAPNGIGKTSILQAIYLALFNDLKLLGVNERLEDFIQNGKSKAIIEMKIFDPGYVHGFRTVKRTISKGSSRIYIDGSEGRRDVDDFVKECNLAISALTSAELAEEGNINAWEPSRLLERSVSSLGGSEKAEEFNELRKESREVAKLQDSVLRGQRNFDRTKQELMDFEPLLEQVKEANELREKRQVLQYKRLHSQIGKLDVDVETMISHEKDSRMKVEHAKNGIRTLNQSKRQIQSSVETYENKIKNVEQDLAVKEKQWQDKQENAVNDAKLLLEVRENLVLLWEDLKKATDDVIEAEKRKSTAENQLKSTLDDNNYEQSKAKLLQRKDERNQRRKKHEIESDKAQKLKRNIQELEITIADCERRKKNLMNIQEYRMAVLEQRMRLKGVGEIAEFVKQMKVNGEFTGNVYGPVATEINVEYRNRPERQNFFERIVESCVSGWYAGAFVTENNDDANRLIRACRTKLNSLIPDVMVRPRKQPRKKRVVDEQLNKLGIECTVSDILVGPDAVCDVLRVHLNIHNIYVATENAEKHLDELRESRDVMTWYTPDCRYSKIRSRYDKTENIMRLDTSFRELRAKLYDGSNEGARKEEQKYVDEIRNTKDNLNELRKELQKQDEVVCLANGEKLEAVKKVRALEQNMAEIRPIRDEVMRLEKRLVYLKKMRDSSRIRVNQTQDQEQRLRNRVDAALDQDTTQGELKRVQVDLEQLKKKGDELKSQLENIKADLSLHRQELPDLEQDLATKEKEKKKLEKERKAKRDELTALRPRIAQDRLVQIEYEIRSNGNLDLDTIEGELLDVELRLQDLGPLKVHEEEKLKMASRKRDKAIADAKLTEARTRLRNKEGPLKSRFDEFIKWLENAVNRANRVLKRFAPKLGWAVKLKLRGLESAHTLALDVYITLHDGRKKRAEYAELSGGERTCLTVLLAVVLDGCSPVRIIDEVAQGLDNRNLSGVLGILDKAAHDIELVPQLFVALPRKPTLPPGKKFTDSMYMHCLNFRQSRPSISPSVMYNGIISGKANDGDKNNDKDL